MDLNKAQLLLDKINRLYKSMSLDPKNVAQIEKDLMQDYIKSLYDSFMDERQNSPVSSIHVEPTVRKATPEMSPPPVQKFEARQSTPPPVERRVITPPPRLERIIAPPVEEVIVETPPPITSPPPRAATPPPAPTPTISDDGEQLFSLENGTELSHKLSSLPISDLNKAMGINERIFTINELFRGDSRAFKHTMNELNQLSTFEQAKEYLASNVVNQYDWTNKQRRNKAKNFIKLIRRRYF